MDVKITVIRKACYKDLSALYENPIEHACDVLEGQVFISHDGIRPEGLCESAWGSMREFVEELARGGGNFFDGWMKNPRSAMISCNDGFRPVSFYLETINPNDTSSCLPDGSSCSPGASRTPGDSCCSSDVSCPSGDSCCPPDDLYCSEEAPSSPAGS